MPRRKNVMAKACARLDVFKMSEQQLCQCMNDNINKVPNEILVEIFKYFDIKFLNDNIAKVCVRWKSLTQYQSLYSHFTLEVANDMILLGKYPQSRFITSVEIRYEVDLINSLFEQLAIHCPNITSLTVGKCNRLSERHVHRVTRCFPKLKHIDVFLQSYFVTWSFVTAMKNVQSVVLNNHIDEITLRAITEKCKQLKSVHMYGNVQYYPLCHLHTLLAARYEQLEMLTLRCCEVNNRTCDLIVACKSLTRLRLYHSWLITDAGLMALTSLKKLLSLHVTGLKLVTQKGFELFIVALDTTVLQDLNFSSTPFSDNSVKVLCAKKQHPLRFELWQCKKLTLIGIQQLIREIKRLLTLDVDREIPDEMLRLVVNKSDIKYIRLSTRTDTNVVVPADRSLVMSDAFAYSRSSFRGNGEGYSANLTCYAYYRDCLSIEEDMSVRVKKKKVIATY